MKELTDEELLRAADFEDSHNPATGRRFRREQKPEPPPADQGLENLVEMLKRRNVPSDKKDRKLA